MATNVFGLPQDHYRSVTVTSVAALAGVVAALVSSAYVGDPKARMGLYVVGAFVLLQYPLFQVAGIDVNDFGVKDHLYVLFITFAQWYITWTILLTSGASL